MVISALNLQRQQNRFSGILCILFLIHGFCYSLYWKQNQNIKYPSLFVKTATGSVRGNYVHVYDLFVAAFLGIPYAKPPLGDRRFTKADPIAPWEGVLLAYKKPPPCMQYTSKNIVWMPTSTPSEDCLYLNIWVPTKVKNAALEKLPVFIWIHGGGFTSGSTDMSEFDGRVLAAYSEVIVVTINFRLGSFGFLNMGTDEAPGNAGMFDQVEAMKWVKGNIKYFGGDPERITLFGESAGSMAASLHLISPLSRDLFHRVILESSTMYNPLLADDADTSRKKAKDLADAVGCIENEVDFDNEILQVIQCLKRTNPFTLAKVEDRVRLGAPSFFLPSSGNAFLPNPAFDTFESGDIAPVEVLMGNNKDEGTLPLYFTNDTLFPLYFEPRVTLKDVDAMLGTFFKTLSNDLLQEIKDVYFKNVTKEDKLAITDALQHAMGDFRYNCPVLFLAEKLNNVYMYWMSHRSPKLPFADWLGVFHFSDVYYVFGQAIVNRRYFTPEDARFSYEIMQKWANFALNGYPLTDEGKQDWPKFTPSEPVTYELNPRISRIFDYPRKSTCEFWRKVFKNL